VPGIGTANIMAARPKEITIVTKFVLVALLATGLTVAAAETEKESKNGTPAAAAADSQPAAAAKTAKTTKTPKKAKATRPAKAVDSAAGPTKQTPFGPVAATPEQPRPRADFAADPFVSAEERGEMVIFRRKTPFGSQVWKKKKSALTAEEQALLARGRPQAPQSQPPAAAAPAKDAPPPATPDNK
jgi:hypothetical protein